MELQVCATHWSEGWESSILSLGQKGRCEWKDFWSLLSTLTTERGEMPRILSSRPAWPSKMQCMIPNTTKHPMCTLRFFERILTAPLQRETEKKIRKTRKNRKFYCLVQMFQPSKRHPPAPMSAFLPISCTSGMNLILKYKHARSTPQQYRFKPFN